MSIDRVFVAGAGLMGHGIGQVHAAIGKRVTLYEPDLARAEAGRARIAGNLDRAVAKGKLDLDTREFSQITDLISGAIAIAPTSPVLAWASQSGRLLFGHFENARNVM